MKYPISLFLVLLITSTFTATRVAAQTGGDTVLSHDGQSRTFKYVENGKLVSTGIQLRGFSDNPWQRWVDSLDISYYGNGKIKSWYSSDRLHSRTVYRTYNPDGTLHSENIFQKTIDFQTVVDKTRYFLHDRLAYEDDKTTGNRVFRVTDSATYKAYQKAFPPEGHAVFMAGCGVCHTRDRKMIGPALKDVTKRHTDAWLAAWITDLEALKKTDSVARKLDEWVDGSKIIHPDKQLTDPEMKALLAYLHTF